MVTASQANNSLTAEPSMAANSSIVTEDTRSPAAREESCVSKSMERGVCFDKIEIREYSRCLGDNPATTHGPSLSIDWGYNIAGTYDLEEYEKTRPIRRESQQMLIPGSVREEMLLKHTDVTRKQICMAVADNNAARHKRQMSVAMQEFEDWARLRETLVRRFRRLRSGVSKKKEQELLWENARNVMESKASETTTPSDSGSDDDGSTQRTDSDTRRSGSSRAPEIAASNQ